MRYNTAGAVSLYNSSSTQHPPLPAGKKPYCVVNIVVGVSPVNGREVLLLLADKLDVENRGWRGRVGLGLSLSRLRLWVTPVAGKWPEPVGTLAPMTPAIRQRLESKTRGHL